MSLNWYQWIALVTLGICLISCLLHFLRLVSLGTPKDLSRPAGNTTKGVLFAFTGAMSPSRKESAFLHLPTYTAGIFFHIGTFLSLLLFFLFIFDFHPAGRMAAVIVIFLGISSSGGIAILLKRIIKQELRSLSNPDDFISNILVTLFQLSTLLTILSLTVFPSLRPSFQIIYYLVFTFLALYIPIGKLRHTVYFFAARYHLGYFFGRRGVWPAGKLKN